MRGTFECLSSRYISLPCNIRVGREMTGALRWRTMMSERVKAPVQSDERIALANRLMVEHPPGACEHERGLQMLQAVADEDGGGHARWLLGAYFLQVSSRHGAHAKALHWLGLAAAEGIPPAVDRLADLHLSGLAGERSLESSLVLQLRLADQGFRKAAWEAAYLLGRATSVVGLTASSAFLRACALGHVPAYFSLGLRFLQGDGVVRDADFGHALLRRAADGGYIGAAELLAGLPAATFNAQFWYERLKANFHDAHPSLTRLTPGCPDGRQAPHPVVLQLERHLVSIGHSSLQLDAAGRAQTVPDSGTGPLQEPVSWDWLSQRPRIAICEGFATKEECAHLINKVAANLRAAGDYLRRKGGNDDAELSSFSGRGNPIGPLHTDAVTRMLESRVSALTHWPVAYLEPCSIICYRPGEEYKPHTDFFTDDQMMVNERERRDFGGQRVATFLLYLKAPTAGGETSYLSNGMDVMGEDGMAIIHYNVARDGRQDPASVHAGRPIISGEKWLWRSTLRERSLYVDPHAST